MRRSSCVVAVVLLSLGCTTDRPLPEGGPTSADRTADLVEDEEGRRVTTASAPKAMPDVPRAEAWAAWAPPGYRVEVVVRDLTYPTSVDFDDLGNLYVAEAGYAYGDLVSDTRIWRIGPDGYLEVACDRGLVGPITDLLWHAGRLYVSHRGKVSALEADGALVDLVTDLPSFGDHHNNQLALGPDGKLYLGQGTATNSGVVGLDNVYPYLWLTQHPDVHDVPPRTLELTGVTYTTPDPLTVLARQGEMVSTFSAVRRLLAGDDPLLVRTGPFQPFGRSSDTVEGRTKANGTILRFDLDGQGLEVFAWGLRNPFGLTFGPDGALYASEDGFDERGSRPIANAPDCVWVVRQGAWYGWPDHAAGVPVTDPCFRPTRGDAPELLMRSHPPCETPFLTRPPHASPTKLEAARGNRFGPAGALYMAEFGGGEPLTGPPAPGGGPGVVRIDLGTRRVERIFGLQDGASGPAGWERVATPGPRRPVDVRLAPDGEALYVVDFGALGICPAGAGPVARPFPGSGVLWRIVRKEAAEQAPPADLSPLPGRSRAVK